MEKLLNLFRYFKHYLFSGFYHLGWPVVFRRNVVINNAKFIFLGNNVILDYDCVVNVITRHQKYKYDYQKPIIKIDDNVGITRGAFISAAKSIQIKRNVMIGPYCFIGDYDHAYEDTEKPICKQPLKNINPVVIGEGAWIGAHVTIASGVTVGKNSVIGAGSVVTKDIPPYSVAVGVPAKVIKKYNPKSRKWQKIK